MATHAGEGTPWRTGLLAGSSISFAVATVLDLSGAEGLARTVAVALSIGGFVALGTVSVASWLLARSRRKRHRVSAVQSIAPLAPLTAAGMKRAPTPQAPPLGVDALVLPEGGRANVTTRLAGVRDLTAISAAGKDAIGSDFFYDPEELEAYLLAQRDSVWCLERTKDGGAELIGYVILLALKPITVERIKSGEIAFGRHILSTDLESAIDNTDAVYLSMIHGYDLIAQFDLGLATLQRLVSSHDKRRPQLILARRGTQEGERGMRRLGFAPFGRAPSIQATFTDDPRFQLEIDRRAREAARLRTRKHP